MVVLALWSAIIQPSAHAQISTTGIVNGTVADPTGSAIAGAKISISNTATGAVSETGAGGFGQIASMKNPRIGELVLKLRF